MPKRSRILCNSRGPNHEARLCQHICAGSPPGTQHRGSDQGENLISCLAHVGLYRVRHRHERINCTPSISLVAAFVTIQFCLRLSISTYECLPEE